jgi:hypothetical protein
MIIYVFKRHENFLKTMKTNEFWAGAEPEFLTS